jgi:hypothetical protein
MSDRPALFISHASPDDNRFVVWLGAKLAALGYEVWADVLKLRGGDDWQRKLEGALRQRTGKLLFVANPVSANKQGVRNEIQIASDVARAIGDAEFIIPLRLAPFEAPFLIAHAQYIDFAHSWSRGLVDLRAALDDYQVPRNPASGAAAWRELQLIHARTLAPEPETLVSNWLEITTLPESVRIYDFRPGISLGAAKAAINAAPWPLIPFKRGFMSFAPIEDLEDHFGLELPLEIVAEASTRDFLEHGLAAEGIAFWDARRHFTDLVRRASDAWFKAAGLASHEFANDRLAWWLPSHAASAGKIAFKWPGLAGQRQIQGESVKRNVRWHYGVSVTARIAPIAHLRVIGRLIFTTDGATPLDAARNQRLRRSFAKSWRNARWRDMLLAFLWRLAQGEDQIRIPVSASEALAARLPPLTFEAPVRVIEGAEQELDEDDPSEDDEPDVGGAEEIDGEEDDDL